MLEAKRKNILIYKKEMFRACRKGSQAINKQVEEYNRIVRPINTGFLLKRIGFKYKDFGKLFPNNFTSKDYKKFSPHLEQLFASILKKEFDSLINGTERYTEVIHDAINNFALKSFEKRYRKHLVEMADVYILGYKSTALLILGKIFEDVVTRYLVLLRRQKKIQVNLNKIQDMRFENKLGLLKSENKISEKDWLIISKLRFDRNQGAHPINQLEKKELEKEAESTIRLSLLILKKYLIKIRINRGCV